MTNTSSSLEPLLFSMMTKLLKKGMLIEVVETHAVWSGNIIDVKLSGAGRAEGAGDGIEVKVRKRDEHGGIIHTHSFNIMQPERWRLAKGDERWMLIPPKSSAPKTP